MSRIFEALMKAELLGGSFPAKATTDPSSLNTVAFAYGSQIASDDGKAMLCDNGILDVPQTGGLRIEKLLTDCTHSPWRPNQDLDVFSNPIVNPVIASQFGTLFTRLQQMSGQRPLKIVLITSSIPAEGKTFTTGNLAQTIVRQGDRSVLIIDADLRRGGLHGFLGAPCHPGLTEYLTGGVDEIGVIQHGQKER